MKPSEPEWDFIDRLIAGHEGYYDTLAQEFEAEETEAQKRRDAGNRFMDGLFRGGAQDGTPDSQAEEETL
jgi:hypothetical protein